MTWSCNIMHTCRFRWTLSKTAMDGEGFRTGPKIAGARPKPGRQRVEHLQQFLRACHARFLGIWNWIQWRQFDRWPEWNPCKKYTKNGLPPSNPRDSRTFFGSGTRREGEMIGSLLDGKETGTSWNTVKKVKGAWTKPHLDWQRFLFYLIAFSGV